LPERCFSRIWLRKVYESVRPTDARGALIWTALRAKTIDLVHFDEYLEGRKDPGKAATRIQINLVARIQKHGNDPKFIKLGERLEELNFCM